MTPEEKRETSEVVLRPPHTWIGIHVDTCVTVNICAYECMLRVVNTCIELHTCTHMHISSWREKTIIPHCSKIETWRRDLLFGFYLGLWLKAESQLTSTGQRIEWQSHCVEATIATSSGKNHWYRFYGKQKIHILSLSLIAICHEK